MDPVLIALWATGLVFFVAGLLTYRYVIGGRTRHSRNSWAAPEIRVWKAVETEPVEAEHTLLERQIDEIMKQW